MGRITLEQAAAWCGGYVDPKYKDVTFFGAGNDSRQIEPGQLFVVLQGLRDGHDYIPIALEKGAAAVLCTRQVGDAPSILVDDPRIALGKIAREERKRIGCKVVGITGSVGKSTTKEMVAAVLESTYRIHKTPVNHNNDIGMPMAILAMPEDTQIAVLEMGMNHFREMAYLSSIALPDMAVIVNIGTMHIEYLGNIEGIRQAKLEILEGMNPNGRLLLNGDDALLRTLPSTPVQEITYFGSTPVCGVRVSEIKDDPGKLSFRVDVDKKTFHVELGIEGRHYVLDAAAAIAVGLQMEVPPEQIVLQLAAFQNLAGRQEIFQAKGCTIISDCYNAGPESMAAALQVLGKREGRRIAVLGDMLELGDCAWPEHYRIGRIAKENADFVYAYGPHAARVVGGALTGGIDLSKTEAFDDQANMAAVLKRIVKPGDVLLFKGSRGMHMEKVLSLFLQDDQ